MARTPREHRLETRDARAKLKVRGEPYWRQIVTGTFIGYRKGKRATAWVVRQRVADGYAEQHLGRPDDAGTPDGEVVLTYTQAVALAQSVKVEDRKPAPRHYADGLTLNQVFDDYIDQRQSTPGGRFNRVMPSSTAEMSKQVWSRHAREVIGAKLVTALDAKAMRKWHRDLATIAPTIRGKAMTFDRADPEQVRSRQASANRILTMAKAALTWARKHDALPDDMSDWWRNVSPFALGDDPVPRMLEPDEITRLLGAAEKDLRTLLNGALLTGCRYGELGSLRVRDYDAAQKVVRVFQSKTYKTITQPLTTKGVALFGALTADKPKDALIFTRSDGSPWGRCHAAKPMAAAVGAAKLDDVSFKTTRATYGKLLLIATKDLELVAKALGHSDSRITRKHYAALLPSELKAGIDKLSALEISFDS